MGPQEREKIVAAFLKNSAYGIVRVDDLGNISEANANAERLFGFAEGQLVGQPLAALIFSDSLEAESGRTQLSWIEKMGGAGRELRGRNRDGKAFPLHFSIGWQAQSDGKSWFIGIFRDLTEEKERERQAQINKAELVQAAKMASLGEIVAGIAHEINNPLAIIQLQAGFLRDLIEGEEIQFEQLLKGIAKIEATSIRLAKVVKGLLRYARSDQEESFTGKDLQVVFQDALEIVGERFRQRGMELVFPSGVRRLLVCRAVQLEQVLINLLNNAFDAVCGTPSPWVQVGVDEFAGWVRISVTDSGPGIPPYLAERIMEPFFTTKPVGKGTGLGLSISKGIIEEHGGRLWLDAKCPNTRFVIDLPDNPASPGPLPEEWVQEGSVKRAAAKSAG